MKAHLTEFWTDRRILFISFAFVIYALLTSATHFTAATWLYMLGGVVFFFVIEYITHRFILHGLLQSVLPRAHEGHEMHHVEPTNLRYLLTPNTYNVPGHVVLWIAFTLLFHSIHAGSAIMLGVTLYQIDYEWTHFVSHRPIIPVTPFGKRMKKYHLLHHYKNPHYWYGVTNPAIDMAVGTSPKAVDIPTEGPRKPVDGRNASAEATSETWV